MLFTRAVPYLLSHAHLLHSNRFQQIQLQHSQQDLQALQASGCTFLRWLFLLISIITTLASKA